MFVAPLAAGPRSSAAISDPPISRVSVQCARAPLAPAVTAPQPAPAIFPSSRRFFAGELPARSFFGASTKLEFSQHRTPEASQQQDDDSVLLHQDVSSEYYPSPQPPDPPRSPPPPPPVYAPSPAMPPEVQQAAAEPASSSRILLPFDWRRSWYPLAFMQDLPRDLPMKFSLFGEPLVIFVDKDGHPRVLEDRCPHRMVPLSQGRVVDGQLECQYHGWQFSGAGECTKIPQLPPGTPIPRRACARALPAVLRQGLVWVWADASSAPDESLLPLSDVLARPRASSFDMTRDLPISYEIVLENLLDPSHVPFAHHGAQGRRSGAAPVEMEISERGPRGFAGRFRVLRDGSGTVPPMHVSFEAPGKVELLVGSGMMSGSLLFYVTPMGRDSSRLHARFVGMIPAFLARLLPGFVAHIGNNLVLDQDMLLMVEQQRRLRALGGDWRLAYAMPASADRFIGELRRWFDTASRDLPNRQALLDYLPGELDAALPPESVLIDRYEQHVKNCASCRRALAVVRGTRRAASIAASAGSAAAVVALASREAARRAGGAAGSALGLPLIVAAGAALAAAGAMAETGLRELEKQFTYAPSDANKRE